MATTLSQVNCIAQIKTPLPDNTLVLRSAHLEEQLGQLFRFELELLSEKPRVSPEDLLGKEVSIRLDCGLGRVRFFHGIVSGFMQPTRFERYFRYHATIVPKLWLLTRKADCRIFQNKKVPDIVEEVCKNSGIDIAERRFTGNYTPWEYCVQYRETDLHFISRLMEQEGIYYFFEHEQNAHRLILADNPGAHRPIPGYEEVSFRPRVPRVDLEDQHMRDWAVESRFNPDVFVHTDFDFARPRLNLRTQDSAEKKTGQGEIFDFPGEYTELKDGEDWARVRMQAIEAGNVIIQGFADAMGLKVGGTFALTETPPEIAQGEFLMVSTAINMETNIWETTGSSSGSGDVFGCSLTAMDARRSFRPARTTLKPLIRGVQTAVVTGPKGEEIHTDKFGRIKVQFHWDRRGKKDENTTCFIRVAEPWAGKRWGSIFTPRIGQEVVVSFLEGDPDQPLITGSVYNGDQMPPYDLPANKTQSGVKTRSTLNGTPANFNEIRFEDKKGHEQLYIHAEKNEDIVVESNKTENVGYDETIKIGHDRTEEVGHDQSITVLNDDTLTVAMNQHLTIGINQDEAIGQGRTTTIGVNDTLSVGAARATNIGAADSLNVGGAISITAGGVITITAAAAITITSSATIAITAPAILLNGRPVLPVPTPI